MRQRYNPNIFDDLEAFVHSFGRCCTDENSECCTEKSCKSYSSNGLSISEDEQTLYIDAPVPGLQSDQVKVTLDPRKRHLSICGGGKHDRENVKYHVKGSRRYCYEVPLSDEIDLDAKIEARSKNGILSIALPKNKRNKPLNIDVQ
ncbi:MAG: hypothetical protein KR126chlam1_00685 [Chlamydiae bacterium]|nr:hypothetical protein [Chlamydiota bacterium]